MSGFDPSKKYGEMLETNSPEDWKLLAEIRAREVLPPGASFVAARCENTVAWCYPATVRPSARWEVCILRIPDES